jgi:hypothetical protein
MFEPVMVRQRQRQQDRDDGIIARGRSPPPLRWEDTTLQETQRPQDEESDSEEDTEQPIVIYDEDSFALSPVIPDTEDEHQNTPEASDDEYSDDEGPTDNELLHFTIDAPEPIRRMVLMIVRLHEEVFPKVQGKRRLHRNNFDNMLNSIRREFWNYRQLNIEGPHHYVRDMPPMGSRFDGSGGYHTPDGIYISKRMRERTILLAQRFDEIHRIQENWQNDLITEQQMRNQCAATMSLPDTPPAVTVLPLPVWTGQILGKMTLSTRGLVSTSIDKGRITVRPRNGPLNWEVCLEDPELLAAQTKN